MEGKQQKDQLEVVQGRITEVFDEAMSHVAEVGKQVAALAYRLEKVEEHLEITPDKPMSAAKCWYCGAPNLYPLEDGPPTHCRQCGVPLPMPPDKDEKAAALAKADAKRDGDAEKAKRDGEGREAVKDDSTEALQERARAGELQ